MNTAVNPEMTLIQVIMYPIPDEPEKLQVNPALLKVLFIKMCQGIFEFKTEQVRIFTDDRR